MQLISVIPPINTTLNMGCAVYESACVGRVHVEFTTTSYGRVFVQTVHQVGPDSWADLTTVLTPQIFRNIEAEIAKHLKQEQGIAA